MHHTLLLFKCAVLNVKKKKMIKNSNENPGYEKILVHVTDLRTTETLSGWVLARVCRITGPCPGYLELRVLVVRLIRYEHPNFTPSVEKHYYSTDPDHQDQHYDGDFDSSNLKITHRKK